VSESAEKSNSKPATPLPWVILSGVLGVFAVGAPIANNPAAPKSDDKNAPAAATAVAPISRSNPLKAVSDFYHTQPDDADADEATAKKEEKENQEPLNFLQSRLHNYPVEFLIATVPDPIDTPYGFAFDQVVDAIQRSVEKKDGYVLDRAWLPWELDKFRMANKSDSKPPLNLRESRPGVLLFQHGRFTERQIDRKGICVVFLVGETPLGGLHKRAFTRALQIMASAGHSVTEPVRVVGPYFSGSQTSLQFVLGDWWKQASSLPVKYPLFHFDIITGNASALRKKDFFELDPYTGGHPYWQADKFQISSTVIPTRLIITAMLRYLTERDSTQSNESIRTRLSSIPGKVALLTEANTSFGKSVNAINGQDIIKLRFPLHISHVENEYTQAVRKKDQQNGLTHDDLLVPANFDLAKQAKEGVPAQGGDTTTTVNAQVLSNILTTIAREQCRYVGVVASDTRDKLFLIRLIREYCPDVHVFVTDADQLLLHPDYRYYMRGVIVGSTYPLLAQNQHWVNPASGERALFATVGAQGCYNAVLMHLGQHDQLLEYAPPCFVERSEESARTSRQRPPIWISVVSPNGSMVPLQVFTDYDDSAGVMRLNPEPSTEAQQTVPLSYPGAMLPVGFALLVFWGALVYHALFARSSRMFWEPAGPGGEFSLPQLCYRNVLLGSQAMLALPVLAIVWTHAHANQYRSFWMPALVGVTLFLASGFVLGMLKPLCWPPSRLGQFAHWLRPGKLKGSRLELWCWAAVNVALVALLLGFAALFLTHFWVSGGPTRRTFYFLRAVDLASGLSPLTPLFFLSMAFASWAYFQLKRAHQIDRYEVPPPFPVGAGDSPAESAFARINELDRVAQEEVRHETSALRHGQATALTGLLLLALGLAAWLQSLPTVEGWSWDGLFFAGFCLLFALNLSILVRLFFVWRSTKRLLNAIALIPMMRAFGRLPAKVADLFGKYLFTQKPRLEHMQLPLHQLRLLTEAAHGPEAPAELAELRHIADALERRLQEGLDAPGGKTASHRAERDLRGKLSAVAASCLTALAPRWKALPVEDAYGEGVAKASDDKPKEGVNPEEAWVPLAENVVAAQIIIYLSQFFAQVRGLAVAVVVCTSLLLLSATSYPFHPERLLLLFLLGLSGAGLAAVVWVLFDMNRDEVVSRILKTTPGKISLDSGVVGSFLTYVVPAVGILTAQLSGSFRWLLEPIMHVMK
jgi:hypothetical protein